MTRRWHLITRLQPEWPVSCLWQWGHDCSRLGGRHWEAVTDALDRWSRHDSRHITRRGLRCCWLVRLHYQGLGRKDRIPFQAARGHTDTVSSIALSPSGKDLYSGSFDHSVCVWDLNANGISKRALSVYKISDVMEPPQFFLVCRPPAF